MFSKKIFVLIVILLLSNVVIASNGSVFEKIIPPPITNDLPPRTGEDIDSQIKKWEDFVKSALEVVQQSAEVSQIYADFLRNVAKTKASCLIAERMNASRTTSCEPYCAVFQSNEDVCKRTLESYRALAIQYADEVGKLQNLSNLSSG
jgi:hypothetical protein